MSCSTTFVSLGVCVCVAHFMILWTLWNGTNSSRHDKSNLPLKTEKINKLKFCHVFWLIYSRSRFVGGMFMLYVMCDCQRSMSHRPHTYAHTLTEKRGENDPILHRITWSQSKQLESLTFVTFHSKQIKIILSLFSAAIGVVARIFDVQRIIFDLR